MRALIHFQNGELADARQLLEELLKQTDAHAPAHDALARVYFADGNVEAGNHHLARATEIRQQLTKEEQRLRRLAAISESLKQAWTNKELPKCEGYLLQMIQLADAKQQIALYRRLASVQSAQGHEDEAAQSLEKAKRLTLGPSP